MAEDDENEKKSKAVAMETEKLPESIIADILSRLPVKPLLRFKCVSKPWCALITDPSFVKMHLSRSLATDSNTSIISTLHYRSIYSVDLDDCEQQEAVELDNHPGKSSGALVIVVDSCNGLLCVSYNNKDIYFWNPCTRRHHQLPIIPVDYPGDYDTLRYIDFGFGYDSTTNDYKLVRVFQFGGSDDDYYCDSVVDVYSLSTNSWRRLMDIPYYLIENRSFGGVVNSSHHWVAMFKMGSDPAICFIVSFDFRDEEYRELALPAFEDNNFEMNVGALGGQLCVICNFFKIRVDVWLMKDYGVSNSWVKQFSLQPSFKYIRPVCYTKNGEVLLNNNPKGLVMYDPNSGSVRKHMIRGVPNKWKEMDTYVGSLVPLDTKDRTEQEAERKKKNRKRKKKEYQTETQMDRSSEQREETHGRMAGTRVCPTSINVPSKSYDDVLRENAELRAGMASLKEDVNSLRAEVAMVLQLVRGNQQGVGNMYASDVGES